MFLVTVKLSILVEKQLIEILAKDKGEKWSTSRFNDYEIMYKWFKEDCRHQQFRPTKYGGFNVQVPEIYDKAIEELTRKIREHKPSEPELMIIEFARYDYSSSLQLLGSDLLQDAYFLLLHADIKICMQRVQQRARNPHTLDDYFVPDSVFATSRRHSESYIDSTVSALKTMYGIEEQRIKVVENNASPQNLYNELEKLVDWIKSRAEKNAGLSILSDEPG